MQQSGHTAQRSFSGSGHTAKRSVLIALSGGIDSTAAALMLLEQGYSLIGCTFTTRYTQPSSIEAAQRVAAQLAALRIRDLAHRVESGSLRVEDPRRHVEGDPADAARRRRQRHARSLRRASVH